MITADGLSLSFGARILFENVNVKFTPGNCYGLIGANGAGKSTFLKILAGEVEPSSGRVSVPSGFRISTLKQDHFAFNEVATLTTVIMGHARLYEVMQEKDAIYAKPDFSDEDGIKAAELEGEFADLDGWNAEANAAVLLAALGIREEQLQLPMKDLTDSEKVRVLLAQALFGEPDILLLDEPTNHLDVDSILWLENFLLNFRSTVVVVSHDRHFLNKVCTHIADVDFQKVTLFTGNYAFWYQTSQIALRQRQNANQKKAEQIKELQSFIARFSANASKSKQATSRKALLDKITLDDIKPSSRKYPFIRFKPEKALGKDVLTVTGLGLTVDGDVLFKDLNFSMQRGERIALTGDERAVTALLDVLAGEREPDTGEVRWGATVNIGYLQKEYGEYFETDLSLINWLRQYSTNQDEDFVRGFLGRMLFSGDETQKSASVLSGGEKVRCMLSRLMLRGPNILLLNGPTNHLDLESITAFNNGLLEFEHNIIVSSHDVQFVSSLATRVLDLCGADYYDMGTTYDEFLVDPARLARIGRAEAGAA